MEREKYHTKKQAFEWCTLWHIRRTRLVPRHSLLSKQYAVLRLAHKYGIIYVH